MALRKRRKLLATGLLTLTLAAVLVSRPHCPGNRPGTEEGKGRILAGHTFPVRALAFGPDGASLASAAFYTEGPTSGVEVAVWDAETGHRVATHLGRSGGVLSLVFAPGGQRLVAIQGRELVLWEVAPWHERRLEGPRPLASALAFSDDGARLAAADFEDVTLWDLTGSRPRACWTRQDGAVSLAVAPGGAVVASGGADGAIRLWDAATGQPRGGLRGHTAPVLAMTFAPDGTTLASAEFRGAVKFWDVEAQTERATLRMGGEEVSALAFAPNGRILAVAVGRAVQLWDVDTGHRVARLEGHGGQVKCLAYSPDGRLLASGSYDQTVRLWDTARCHPSRLTKP
jgi:WD40 repeat protein